jgi:hypothetical protein
MEKHWPNTYIVKFSCLIEQDFELKVKAANEDDARKAVETWGIDAHIESVELSQKN